MATVILAVVTIITALVLMLGHFGLVDSLDFGAGAYYYADIPEFDKYVRTDSYNSTLPISLAIVLFLAWGALMYWLWTKIDKN